MRVLFIARATLYTSPGGDTTQLDRTAEALRLRGVTVDVALAHTQPDYSRYDLLHFFNIIRPADILRHTARTALPYVVSTIFVQYGAADRVHAGPARRILSAVLSEDRMEHVKAVARWIKNGEAPGSRRYLLRGHRWAVQEVARHAACLLPNSESEYRRFAAAYGGTHRYRVVPNGVNTGAILKAYPKNAAYDGAVLCMGRIEPRKNQLQLIHALKNSPFQLRIHGAASPNHQAYLAQCREAAAPNVQLLPWLAEEALYSAYASAKVHVLPSYFETTGLSSLEAAAMGCNIVVTDRGDTRDYFGDDAWYCEPEDPASIRRAVEAAHAAPYNPGFRRRILEQYTWDRAGEETLAAYREVFGARR